MAHDVFISHSSKDKITADTVCAVLESKGIRCWVAPRDIYPGADWGESILKALQGCRVMVLIFSGHANQSPQIKREVNRAVDKGIPIIPFRIENVPPTGSMEYSISTAHWLDAFTPPLETHIDYLAKAIQALEQSITGEMGSPFGQTRVSAAVAARAKPSSPSRLPPPRRPGLKWRLIAPGIALLLLFLVGLGFYEGVMQPTEMERQHQVAQQEADARVAAQGADQARTEEREAAMEKASQETVARAVPAPQAVQQTAVVALPSSPTKATSVDSLQQFQAGDYACVSGRGGELSVTGPFPTDDHRETWVCTGAINGTWTTGPVAGHPQLTALPPDASLPKGWAFGLSTQGNLIAVRQLDDKLVLMEPRMIKDQWDRVNYVPDGATQNIFQQRPPTNP